MNRKGTYVEVRIEEMRELFKAEKGWKESVSLGNEIVFDFTMPAKPYVTVRVWSSIHTGNRPTTVGDFMNMAEADRLAFSASNGQDSIKVCAFNNKTDRGIRKSLRSNRVEGWQGRVKSKVVAMIKDIFSDRRV